MSLFKRSCVLGLLLTALSILPLGVSKLSAEEFQSMDGATIENTDGVSVGVYYGNPYWGRPYYYPYYRPYYRPYYYNYYYYPYRPYYNNYYYWY